MLKIKQMCKYTGKKLQFKPKKERLWFLSFKTIIISNTKQIIFAVYTDGLKECLEICFLTCPYFHFCKNPWGIVAKII